MRHYKRCFYHPGRLIKNSKNGLRARTVALKPKESMDWHSTGRREELILSVKGTIRIEIEQANRKISKSRLSSGFCFFIPSQVVHRVINASSRSASYVYVTGSQR